MVPIPHVQTSPTLMFIPTIGILQLCKPIDSTQGLELCVVQHTLCNTKY